MDKRLVVVIFSLTCLIASSGQITNVSQCVGVELTPAVLADISSADRSTPQRSFLGFVKGVIEGDYLSFLRHLTDDAKEDECGTSDISIITAEMTNSFYQTVQSMSFSNHMILAYSEIATNLIWQLSATMQSQKGAMVKMSFLEARLVNANGEWLITSWDVDE